ncbi:uncharacterized protein cubi_00592 [Cryptosporidium ubiquitum]|uniref:Uncharacterized protein n=1 Tax=Cryptosporidium ubiquitum TaxID=857276 RepID=A0A1J4MC31_9CRYT|nr:uncharacterized protein cubi_00592 [Cryptosporidium ubiquitum]OII71785.1 hypothetical protein cubi_00592 [Cryptosporidium ubiquitum]
METLRNATCIPHISGKLIFGYSLNLRSFYECENRWNMLSDVDKSKFIEISKRIRNDILFGLIPLQNWNGSEELKFSKNKLFYCMNYPSQLYLFPHLAENQILRKCGKKLHLINKEKYICQIIDRYLEKLAKHKFV